LLFFLVKIHIQITTAKFLHAHWYISIVNKTKDIEMTSSHADLRNFSRLSI